ncbi:twin-arginine translocation signal domain-containing protein [Streptomyces sp. NPDC059455]
MVRMTRRGALVGVVAAVLAVAGLGAYPLWPALQLSKIEKRLD